MDDAPLTFGRAARPTRKPCRVRELVWFYEAKGPELPPGAVTLGKHCVLDLPILRCTLKLGQAEMDANALVAALRDNGGPSIPDPNVCD